MMLVAHTTTNTKSTHTPHPDDLSFFFLFCVLLRACVDFFSLLLYMDAFTRKGELADSRESERSFAAPTCSSSPLSPSYANRVLSSAAWRASSLPPSLSCGRVLDVRGGQRGQRGVANRHKLARVCDQWGGGETKTKTRYPLASWARRGDPPLRELQRDGFFYCAARSCALSHPPLPLPPHRGRRFALFFPHPVVRQRRCAPQEHVCPHCAPADAACESLRSARTSLARVSFPCPTGHCHPTSFGAPRSAATNQRSSTPSPARPRRTRSCRIASRRR